MLVLNVFLLLDFKFFFVFRLTLNKKTSKLFTYNAYLIFLTFLTCRIIPIFPLWGTFYALIYVKIIIVKFTYIFIIDRKNIFVAGFTRLDTNYIVS